MKKPKVPKVKPSTAAFEKAAAAMRKEHYVLRLYVTGTTARSIRAITNIKRICDSQLKGRCTLEVVDVYQQPTLAEGEQIVAAPTLVKKMPLPLRKLVGDFSNLEDVLLGLDLKKRNTD